MNSDSNFYDNSKNRLHLTSTAITSWVGAGTAFLAYAPSLNGTDDYIDIDPVIPYITDRSHSFFVWIKFASASSDTLSLSDAIIGINSSTGATDNLVMLTLTTGIRMYINNSLQIAGTIDIDDLEWHHVGYVYDDDNDEVRQYVDGTLDVTHGSITTTGIASTDKGSLGQEYDSSLTRSNFFNGYFNDARFYDHALTTKEVKELAKGEIVHWQFSKERNASGDIIEDSSGYDYTATLNANAPVWSSTTGDGVGCYTFTAANSDYIQTTVNNVPEVIKKITVALWVYWTTSTGWDSFFHTSTSAALTSGVWFGYYGTGTSLFRWSIENDNTHDFVYNTINTGQWYHIAATYDGTLTANNAIIYVNGQAVTTFTRNNGAISGQSGIKIGMTGSDEYAFNGKIADFRLYHNVLSANDILQIYRTSASLDNKGNFWC
jgi:hypothetical protein